MTAKRWRIVILYKILNVKYDAILKLNKLNKLNKSSKLKGICRKHIICKHSDWVKILSTSTIICSRRSRASRGASILWATDYLVLMRRTKTTTLLISLSGHSSLATFSVLALVSWLLFVLFRFTLYLIVFDQIKKKSCTASYTDL